MSQQDWKDYWNNPGARQYITNYFWNHIGYEQGTNRAIFHDGTMENAQYLDDWKFIYQNNQDRYLFDRQNLRLYDVNLNYYDGRGYYSPDHRLIEDAYDDYIYELKDTFKEKDKLLKSLIDQDPLYGNGRAQDPINTTYSDYFTNYSGTNAYSNKNRTIFKNSQQNNGSYTVGGDEVFKRKFTKTQQAASKVQKPNQNTEPISKEMVKKTIDKDPVLGNGNAKEPISFVQNKNTQQEAVDKLIEELKAKQVESENIDTPVENIETPVEKPDGMIKKQLTGETSQEKMFSSSKLDTRGRSMTQAVDDYNSKLRASTTSNVNVTGSAQSNIYKPVRNVDAPTVGKIVTGAIDNNTVDLAAKVAADFSQFRYGKIISKLF
jgi:hypothetical protein